LCWVRLRCCLLCCWHGLGSVADGADRPCTSRNGGLAAVLLVVVVGLVMVSAVEAVGVVVGGGKRLGRGGLTWIGGWSIRPENCAHMVAKGGQAPLDVLDGLLALRGVGGWGGWGESKGGEGGGWVGGWRLR
jgi:hypothetical protein